MRVNVTSRVNLLRNVIMTCHRYGNDIYLSGKSNGITLKAIHPGRSAFVVFTLSPQFFDEYEVSDEDTDETYKLAGKMLYGALTIKAALKPEKVTIGIVSDHFVVDIVCTSDVRKVVKLPFETETAIQPVYQYSECDNKIKVDPAMLMDELVSYLSASEEHLSLNAGGELITFRNYIKEEPSKSDLMTEISLTKDKFQSYDIGIENQDVTMSSKEFKTIINFCSANGEQLRIFYSVPGA